MIVIKKEMWMILKVYFDERKWKLRWVENLVKFNETRWVDWVIKLLNKYEHNELFWE